jgi:S-adenosylmethionine:tRNA ribosyltransferase-isomerase
MISKPHIDIQEYNYELPEGCIAQFPLEERDASKLLIWQDGAISEEIFRNIHLHLPKDALVVFNDTRVLKARLNFQKPTGGAIEIFCLEPMMEEGNIEASLHSHGTARWQCLIGNAKRWKEGKVELSFSWKETEVMLYAERGEALGDGCFVVKFTWEPTGLDFGEILEGAGKVPLPPYIQRAEKATDVSQYQTIYAEHDGSVAAPTAGLHFTPTVFENLSHRNISSDRVTLHVGLGTFRPVSARLIADHPMHEEQIVVKTATLRRLLGHLHKPVIAVGTTSVRTLESLYWAGVKMIVDRVDTIPAIDQWDPYDDRYKQGISQEESLTALLNHLERKNADHFAGHTRLLIAPCYEIKMVSGMVTNFHLPQSTLLLLIAAFMGNNWIEAYRYAMDHGFRFLSYGDACLLLKTK